MKKIFIALFMFATLVAYSQENNIKTNLMGALYGNYGLTYERETIKGQTISLTGAYWNLDYGFLPVADWFNFSGSVRLTDMYSGFNTNLEYRFYMNKNTLNGFYMAPYLRYAQHNFMLHDEIRESNFDVETKISGIGAGFQMGYQWIIGNGFTLDWFFVGLGVERYLINGNYVTANSSAFNYSTIVNDVRDVFEGWNYFEQRLTTEPHSDRLHVKLPFIGPGFKSGFSIGYAF
jgi:hypothetical protein